MGEITVVDREGRQVFHPERPNLSERAHHGDIDNFVGGEIVAVFQGEAMDPARPAGGGLRAGDVAGVAGEVVLDARHARDGFGQHAQRVALLLGVDEAP